MQPVSSIKTLIEAAELTIRSSDAAIRAVELGLNQEHEIAQRANTIALTALTSAQKSLNAVERTVSLVEDYFSPQAMRCLALAKTAVAQAEKTVLNALLAAIVAG